MADYTRTTRVAMGAAVVLVAVLAGTGVSLGVLTSGNISADQPDNQQLEVDLQYTGDGTTVDVNLSKDGSVVASTTDSNSTAGTETAVLDMTGLAAGDLNLSVSAVDETNVSVAETRMRTEQTDALNVTANESVTVDVEFDAERTTNATVELLDDTGTTINSTTLTFDPIDYEGGTGTLTAEFVESSDYNFTDVRVTTDNAYGYEAVYVFDDADEAVAGGGFLGASNHQVIGFAALLGGLLVLANREVL